MEEESISAPDFFKKYGFAYFSEALSTGLLSQFTTYVLTKSGQEPSLDRQIRNGTQAVYADTLMESLLSFYLPWVSTVVQKKLVPSFSFYRMYKPGAELTRQRSLVSGEYCASLCLGMDITPVEGEEPMWDFYLDLPDNDGNPGRSVVLGPGSMVIFRSLEVEHWREPFRVAEGSWYIQVDFYYVDAEGPYGEICKFDGRKYLGEPVSAVSQDYKDVVCKKTESVHLKI
jgi:hypothetical protein